MARDRFGWILELLDPRRGDHVLEVGCGHGEAAGRVADRLLEGRLVAVDRSAKMVEATLRRNARHVEAGRMRVVHGDVAALASERFDRVYAVNVVELFTPAALAGIAGRMAPGGRVVLAYEAPATMDVSAKLDALAAGLPEAMAGAGLALASLHRSSNALAAVGLRVAT